MSAIEFDRIHKCLWTDVTAERKHEIVKSFSQKYLRGWIRIRMPVQENAKGVFVYKEPNTNKVLWIEAFSLDSPISTARIWTGWRDSSYQYLVKQRFPIYLCFIFSDSGMFSILPPKWVSIWFRNDPNPSQGKWFIEIAPAQDGLHFKVTGVHRIEDITLSELFMNIELVGIDYPDREPSREELYQLLLRSCSEGIGNRSRIN